MKKIKKAFAMLIIAITVISCIKVNRVETFAASQVEAAINRGRSLIGSHEFDGYCQRFVRICYEAAGIYGWAESATLAGNYWMVSNSRYDIPIGAALYFTGNSEFGHVGIYTGNGCMLHALNGVREEKISDYWWARFRGWGYQGGVYPSGTYIDKDLTPPVISDVSVIRGEDNAFHLQAFVSDNKQLSRTVFALTTDKGDKKFYEAFISGGVAASIVNFSDFSEYEGKYEVSATAVDATGNQSSAIGNEIELDVSAPEITDVEVTDLGFDRYKISFMADDKSGFEIKCFNDDKEVEVFSGDSYYFYATSESVIKAKICATDEYGYIHEKIVEANTGTNEKNNFFHNDVKYELFKPLVKFMKSTHGNNEIKDGMKKISFEIFRVEE